MSQGPGQATKVPGDAEHKMGMRLFYTGTSGVGGKLRRRTEDFIVEEVSLYPSKAKLSGGGRFSAARVKAFNWETNRLVARLARDLGIRKHQVHFAGTKDKRGITTQLMTFEAEPDKVEALSIPDVEITEVYRTNFRLKLGRLYGNRFNILLSDPDVTGAEFQNRLEQTNEQLDAMGGFPNFFGVQRFGAVRPITQNVGRYIVKRQFEKAVWEYIGNPLPDDTMGFEVRSNLVRTGDLEAALAEYPKELEFERAIIHYLLDNPEDYTGALRRFPQNLLAMFVHSYQSYMFNLILCERIERGIPIGEPQIGDLVLPVDKDGLPVHTEWFPVNLDNRSKLIKMAHRHRTFTSGILFGADTQFADGEMGEIERKYIEAEGIVPDDFNIPELLSKPSRGIRRELVASVSDLKMEVEEDSARFTFGLMKGTYATSMLREYMKADARNY